MYWEIGYSKHSVSSTLSGMCIFFILKLCEWWIDILVLYLLDQILKISLSAASLPPPISGKEMG